VGFSQHKRGQLGPAQTRGSGILGVSQKIWFSAATCARVGQAVLQPDCLLDLRLPKPLVRKLFSRWLLLELLLLELLLGLLELLLELLLRLELLLGLLEPLLGLELLLRLLELLLGLELLLLLQESWLDGLLRLLLLCRNSEELLLLLLRLESRLSGLRRLTERLLLLEEGSVGGVSRVDEGVQVLASSAGRD